MAGTRRALRQVRGGTPGMWLVAGRDSVWAANGQQSPARAHAAPVPAPAPARRRSCFAGLSFHAPAGNRTWIYRLGGACARSADRPNPQCFHAFSTEYGFTAMTCNLDTLGWVWAADPCCCPNGGTRNEHRVRASRPRAPSAIHPLFVPSERWGGRAQALRRESELGKRAPDFSVRAHTIASLGGAPPAAPGECGSANNRAGVWSRPESRTYC
jgi:hypothetical protein